MPGRPLRRRGVTVASSALAATVWACGPGGADVACGPVTREALDPGYLVHVVDDDAGVEYSSDPPTSGPHQPAPAVEGIVERPLARPVQVGVLERGDVLVQHDPDLAAADRSALEALAGTGVVVAPNPDLPSPIVATAWLHKRTCETVDADALETFIAERRGKGPG